MPSPAESVTVQSECQYWKATPTDGFGFAASKHSAVQAYQIRGVAGGGDGGGGDVGGGGCGAFSGGYGGASGGAGGAIGVA